MSQGSTQNVDVPPAIAVLQMVTAPWITQAIYVVAKLGIADLLAGRGQNAAELAAATGTHADSLARVMRALVSVGIFQEDGGRYGLTPLGETLRTDAPQTARDFAIMFGESWHWSTLDDLLESVRTGQTAFDRRFGKQLFEFLAENAEAGQVFNRAMTSISSPHVPAIAEAYDFSRFRCMLDIAGGVGHVLAEVLRRNPQMRGILFDLPYAVDAARAALQAHPAASRIEMKTGDFFSEVPEGADLHFLKHIIHDWGDEHCERILTSSRRAIAPDGRLLVAEVVLPEGPEPSFGKFLDLEMLLFTTNGRERTPKEYEALLRRSGYRMERVVPTATEIALVEAVPA